MQKPTSVHDPNWERWLDWCDYQAEKEAEAVEREQGKAVGHTPQTSYSYCSLCLQETDYGQGLCPPCDKAVREDDERNQL
jgi:hypothetical protein